MCVARTHGIGSGSSCGVAGLTKRLSSDPGNCNLGSREVAQLVLVY